MSIHDEHCLRCRHYKLEVQDARAEVNKKAPERGPNTDTDDSLHGSVPFVRYFVR